MKKLQLLLLLALFASLFAYFGCGGNSHSNPNNKKDEEITVPVEIAAIKVGDIAAYFTGTATIETEEGQLLEKNLSLWDALSVLPCVIWVIVVCICSLSRLLHVYRLVSLFDNFRKFSLFLHSTVTTGILLPFSEKHLIKSHAVSYEISGHKKIKSGSAESISLIASLISSATKSCSAKSRASF